MSDLTLTEQKHVRTALNHLRRRLQGWVPVAGALNLSASRVTKLASGRERITASTAFRIARLLGASIDDLLAGQFLPGACPRCGYVPDFADEETVAGEPPPDPSAPVPRRDLKLVK